MQQKQIILLGQNVGYVVRCSTRARRMRLSVNIDGQVMMTLPMHASERAGEKFLMERAEWVLKTLGHMKKFEGKVKLKSSKGEYKEYKEAARALVLARLEYFNRFYKFVYHDVRIKNQSSRWGSCSKKGNLNFNYKIVHLPPVLADYLVVHELCHLKQMNHGPKFWKLVEETIPDYKERRKLLKNGFLVM